VSAQRCQELAAQAAWAELQARGVAIGTPTIMATIKGPLKDITAHSSSMPPDSAILYKNTSPRGEDPSTYRGLLRLESGERFWVGLWPRTVNGKVCVELRLVPAKEERP
jgi:hypothetical protein